MNTYEHQLRDDEARIDNEHPIRDDVMQMADRAGCFSALAYYYAKRADFEAAEHQRILRNATSLVAAYTVERQLEGDFETIIADLLSAIRGALGDNEFHIERGFIEEAAASLRYIVQEREERRTADLDAPAAARSDDEYERKIDAGLIGRGDFLPESP